MAKEGIPQYLRIAADLASMIAGGEYNEGDRLSGLSKLASEYEVSPETARKAVNLLAEMKIVAVKEKSRVVVLSAENAKYYLESLQLRKEQQDLRDHMQELLLQYQELSRDFAETAEQLLSANKTPIPSENSVPTFEVTVGSESDKIGRSIGSIKFWQATGCTIIAIRRGQNLIVAPGPYTVFIEGDVVGCTGLPGSEAYADRYLNFSEPQTGPAEDYHSLWAENINSMISDEVDGIERNICGYLGCRREDIQDITPMQQGLNNNSFSFVCKGQKYVYRHPGVNASQIIDREKEAKALKTAKRLGIDDTLLYVDDASGWKLSRYVDITEDFDFSDKNHVRMLASHLKVLNESGTCLGFEFDYKAEAEKLLDIISRKNKRKYRRLLAKKDAINQAFALLEKDPWQRSMCHNDLYEPNLLVVGDQLHIIDWEFAGDSDIGFDICKLFSLGKPSYEGLDDWLGFYYGRPASREEKLHLIACAAVVYYYWYVWALYADENGENVAGYIAPWHDKMEYYIGLLRENAKED